MVSIEHTCHCTMNCFTSDVCIVVSQVVAIFEKAQIT